MLENEDERNILMKYSESGRLLTIGYACTFDKKFTKCFDLFPRLR